MKSIRNTSRFLRRAQKKPTPKQKKHRKACPSSAQQSHSDRLRCSEDGCSSPFRAVLAPEQSLGGIQTTLLKNKFKVKLVGKEEKHSTGSWLPFLPSHPQITQNTEVSFDLPTASLFPSLTSSLISSSTSWSQSAAPQSTPPCSSCDQSPRAGDVFSCLGMATSTYGALLARLCQ